MLILTRRTGETVMIGNEVTLTVLGVKGNQVRIGINAPKSVPVHREEIFNRIKREQQQQQSGNKVMEEMTEASRLAMPSGHGPGCECQVCIGATSTKSNVLRLKNKTRV